MKRFLFLALMLSGCSEDRASFPSLLPRAIEQRDESEPVRAATTVAADPQLDAKLAEAARASGKVRDDFVVRLSKAEALTKAAKGAPAGSEAWLDAQTALGDLDVLRAELSVTVADLEQLAIDRAATGAPPYPALEAAREQAAAQLQSAARTIATLTGELAPA